MQNIHENFPKSSNEIANNELFSHLINPQKNSSDWQDKAARLTAIEHSNSLAPAVGDINYLLSLALCKLAQNSGVTEAKKRNLQAVRFRSKPAPALHYLEAAELFTPALELLSTLKGDWVSDYIAREIVNPRVDKKGLACLLRWAEKAVDTPAKLVNTILSSALANKVDEKKILFLIKDAANRLEFTAATDSELAAENLLLTVKEIVQLVQESQSKKVGGALVLLLRNCIDKSRQAHPTVLLQGSFIKSIKIIQEAITQPATKKLAQALAFEQAPNLLSALNDLVRFGGDDGANYARLIFPSLRQTFPNVDKVLDEMSKSCPGLKLIKESEAEFKNLEDIGTSIYARLLPAWHDFVVSSDGSDNILAMNSDLLEVAALNGFELMGKLGDRVAFDPISHRLQKSDQDESDIVEILRPAVIFRRSNSYRIVLPAIVLPC